VVADMGKLIESNDGEAGQMALVLTLFPNFTDLFRQIKQEDPIFADKVNLICITNCCPPVLFTHPTFYCVFNLCFNTQCMDHFISYVEGPPNCPTMDKCGLLGLVLGFLSEVRVRES
jgi:hypothetical protein